MSNQHVFINSKNRISGNISNFDLLIKNLDYSVDEYTLLVKEVIIPKTFYNITSNNNIIDLGSTSISITTQNYNATQFLTEFNSNSIGITAGYNTQSGKLMIYNNSGSVYTLNANEKQKYLGFSVGEYSLGTTLMSNQVCDFSGTNIIRLTTDIPIISSNTDNYSQNVLNDIYITEEFGQLIHYENEIRIKTRTNAIQEARFRLLDENGDELELNGRDWNMKLVLQSNDK